MRRKTSCSHPSVTKTLMNPGPATSTFRTNAAGGNAATIASATVRGDRSDPGSNREGDVGCEVPVLLLPGLHHLGLGELAVEPEPGRRGLEARTEPSLELVLDHAPAPPIEPRTVSIKACASKGLVMYRTPGATGVVSSARAVRNTTGIAPSSGSSWSLR